MGTTIVGLLVTGNHAAIGSVGDSRVYLLSGGSLEQVTTDDSWAATILAQDPGMRPEDVANHPMRNVLTNVLGGRAAVEVHVHERALAGGEILLLSSDGIHGVLSHDQLKAVLENNPEPEVAAATIVRMAPAAGSRATVTALVVHYEADK